MARWLAQQRPCSLVELGAGSAAKTRILLDAMREDELGALYVPVDISADFLARTAEALRREYPGLEVAPVATDFSRALLLPPSLPHPTLVTFLGSTIGNFTTAEAVTLLRRLRAAIHPGDRFLLGVDLRKEVSILESAYNDAAGVTAEFNLNLLRVVNRRFGANFDPEGFRHRALYNASEHRVEMHLVSSHPQAVEVPGAGEFVLCEGETIRTEISCKYDRESVDEMLTSAGMELVGWEEGAEALFALAMAAPADEAGRSNFEAQTPAQ